MQLLAYYGDLVPHNDRFIN